MTDSTTDKVELLPCPFCGAQGVIESWESGETFYEYVSCLECDATTDNRCVAGTNEAAEKWNTRARHVQSPSEQVRAAAEEIWGQLDRTWTVEDLEAIITRNVHPASLTDAIEVVKRLRDEWGLGDSQSKAMVADEIMQRLQSLEGKAPVGESLQIEKAVWIATKKWKGVRTHADDSKVMDLLPLPTATIARHYRLHTLRRASARRGGLRPSRHSRRASKRGTTQHDAGDG